MTNLIKVDFRKEKLAIDNDSYLNRVVEIHCRKCERRRPRKNAVEIKQTWGYICEGCHRRLNSDISPDHESSKPQVCLVTNIAAGRFT